jgi:hypothetical protein
MSSPEVIELIQSESGCQWIALEMFQGEVRNVSDMALRIALRGPEFEFVRSFPLNADRAVAVDLYRFKLQLAPPPPVDLTFQGFSGRTFRNIEPIPSRR